MKRLNADVVSESTTERARQARHERRVRVLDGAMDQLDGVRVKRTYGRNAPRSVAPSRKTTTTVVRRQNQQDLNASLVDDLFGDLDSSLRVVESSSSPQEASRIHLRTNPKVSSADADSRPVAVKDAYGAFTKGGMNKLVEVAKRRKATRAEEARKRLLRKKRAEKAAAKEAERAQREAEIERAAKAERRRTHRETRESPDALSKERVEENAEARTDEMEALEAMYPDEFERGEKDDVFSLTLCEGTLRVHCEMPRGYPSSEPPVVTKIEWKDGREGPDETELSEMLEDTWIEGQGNVVIYEWAEALSGAFCSH